MFRVKSLRIQLKIMENHSAKRHGPLFIWLPADCPYKNIHSGILKGGENITDLLIGPRLWAGHRKVRFETVSIRSFQHIAKFKEAKSISYRLI